MALPSVFQGVQDCRLPALKPPKPSRRPPRQQLLQLHAPAIDFIFQGVQDCRLPGFKPSKRFRRLPRQQLLQLHTCPCHLFFRGFKPALTSSKRSRRPPRQQLLQLHAPAICFSGGSRQVCLASNPPNASAGFQGNNSYSYTVATTCPCHLFFRGFKTAVCPASNPPNASNPPAGLQGNNSYSYSYYFKTAVCPASNPPNASNPPAGLGSQAKAHAPKRFQPSRRPPRQQLLQLQLLLQDCRLLGLKPPKRFQPSRRPPRQQLLQLLHAPAIWGSRLPFARPQTPQTLPTLPQASKATTLTATTCPCHLFFRGFKTAVCPPSNPPNPPAGLQGNNSYSSSNPPAGLQGNNSYSYSYYFKTAVCSASNPQTLPTLPQASKATTLTATTCPCHLGFKTAVCPASNPPNASNPPAGLQGNNSYSYYLPLPSVFQGVQDCRLPALKPPKPSRRPPRQQLLQLHAPAICFSGGSRQVCLASNPPNASAGFQGNNSYSYTVATTCPCHLFFRGFKTAVCPASNPPNASNPPAGLQGNNAYLTATILHAPAICFSGGSRLPFARPQTPQTLPQASQATTLTATCPCHRFYFSRGSRLPFAWLQTLQTLPQASKATTLTATYMPLPSVFQGVQARPHTLQTLPQASKATTLTATCPCHLFFRGFTTSLPGLKPSKRFRRLPRQQLLQLHCSYYMPLPSVFQGVQDCRLPGLKPPKRFQPFRRPPRQQLLQLQLLLQDCRLPGLKPPKRFQPSRRPRVASKGTRPQTLPTLPQASKATTLTATATTSRLPFARPQTPQTLPTLPQASKATTLTATTCPCHLGFKTAVCPASNPPNASNPPAGLQGNNSYSYYMPLPSVFQGVQDCRLPALKPPKPSRRPPRQQLLQLHAPAICFSGGSRQVCLASNPPNASAGFQGNNSYSYTVATTCPCHLFFRGFKTAGGCPASNPPNASNPPAGLQGNNSYLTATILHAPAICFSGGSRLPFARPQTPQTLPQASQATTLTATCPCHRFYPPTPAFAKAGAAPGTAGGVELGSPQTLQTLPQASKATTLTATCPCHLFFRGFKTAVCPASNPPNPSAGLQGNNSYSYMPLPSVFQGVQDCRLPGLKPSKPFRRPPRQQLLQLHAPAICFSGGSRLPFARPQTPQTLPQAFFKGVQQLPFARPAIAPNPSAGSRLPSLQPGLLQLHAPAICFSGGSRLSVLPGLKPSKPFRRPPRQQLLQLHAPAICFSGGSRLPFARPQTPQTLPQASKATTLTPAICFSGGSRLPFAWPHTATCPCHLFFRGFCFSGGSRLSSARPQTLQTLPQASKATTLTATCPCHLFFRGFKTAVCPASNPPKPFRRPPRQQLLQLHAPAICFSGGSRLPFARPQTPQTLPQASKATTLTATCPCHLFFRGFKTAVCPASNPPNPSRRPPRQQLLQLHAPAICFSGGSRLPFARPQTPAKPSRRPFSGGSRLPFARPQTPQTLPQASKATTLTATCPCHLFFRGFKTAVCPASNPPNPSPQASKATTLTAYMPLPSVFQGVQDCRLPGLKPPKPSRRPFSGGSRLSSARPQTLQTLPQASKATTLTATCPCHLFFRGFKTAVCPASNPPNPSAGLQGNNSYSYMPLPSVFQGVQDCRLPGVCPASNPPNPPAGLFQGVQDCRLPGLKRSKPLPQASKATTLTATCPCHLFFRGFKTAVCPASNPPNPSAGLQGNNSYSYMPLPSVFQGVQGCRLPGLKPPKPFRRPPRQQLLHLPSVFQGVQDCRLPGLKPPKPFRRPPRQQLLQLHAPAICLSGGSRLPFARPQTLQTLPQASKATTLTPAICFSGGSRLPFARPQTLQTLPQASKATTLTATGPCHLFFRGFKTAVCPASNPPNPSAGLQGNSYMPLPSISFVLFFL